MNAQITSFKNITIGACAAIITAVSSWAFVTSSASVGRDPFQFAAVMAANAQARSAQYQAQNLTRACASEFVSSDDATTSTAATCRNG